MPGETSGLLYGTGASAKPVSSPGGGIELATSLPSSGAPSSPLAPCREERMPPLSAPAAGAPLGGVNAGCVPALAADAAGEVLKTGCSSDTVDSLAVLLKNPDFFNKGINAVCEVLRDFKKAFRSEDPEDLDDISLLPNGISVLIEKVQNLQDAIEDYFFTTKLLGGDVFVLSSAIFSHCHEKKNYSESFAIHVCCKWILQRALFSARELEESQPFLFSFKKDQKKEVLEFLLEQLEKKRRIENTQKFFTSHFFRSVFSESIEALKKRRIELEGEASVLRNLNNKNGNKSASSPSSFLVGIEEQSRVLTELLAVYQGGSPELSAEIMKQVRQKEKNGEKCSINTSKKIACDLVLKKVECIEKKEDLLLSKCTKTKEVVRSAFYCALVAVTLGTYLLYRHFFYGAQWAGVFQSRTRYAAKKALCEAETKVAALGYKKPLAMAGR